MERIFHPTGSIVVIRNNRNLSEKKNVCPLLLLQFSYSPFWRRDTIYRVWLCADDYSEDVITGNLPGLDTCSSSVVRVETPLVSLIHCVWYFTRCYHTVISWTIFQRPRTKSLSLFVPFAYHKIPKSGLGRGKERRQKEADLVQCETRRNNWKFVVYALLPLCSTQLS